MEKASKCTYMGCNEDGIYLTIGGGRLLCSHHYQEYLRAMGFSVSSEPKEKIDT